MKEPRTFAGGRSSSEARDLLISTWVMTAVALAQPILDLLGRNPEFFLARAIPAAEIALFAIGIGVVIPVLLGAMVWVVYRWHPPTGRATHLAILGLLGALLAVTVLRHTPARSASAWWELGSAALFGAALALSYRSSSHIRSAFRFVAISPLVITGAFVFAGPASDLLWPAQAGGSQARAEVRTPAPVVVMVFDEFPVASLLDDSGMLQAAHFPNFAELAEDATWFRNAVGVHEMTEVALPTIVSGVRASPGNLPISAHYPETVFTLLGELYDIYAIETVTELCPESVCENESRTSGTSEDRWRALIADLPVISGHVFLPDDLTAALPPINQAWGNFGKGSATGAQDWNIKELFRDRVDADRRNDVMRFLSLLDEGAQAHEFYFLHVLFPHWPWIHLADGRPYGVPGSIPGTNGAGWSHNAWLVEQAYQRHLLQVQYADAILGDVIDQLKETDSYEDSLIVVMADHGVAIRPGIANRRGITPDTVGDVAAIPLFIKRPGQAHGSVDDYRAETIDVLPTIAGELGIDIPWPVDGSGLFSEARPRRPRSTMISDGGSVTFDAQGAEKFDVAEYHMAYFGNRGPYGIAPLGYSSLLGTAEDELAIGQPSEYRALINQGEVYERFRREDDVAPLLMTGIVSDETGEGTVLAVSINGRVEAVTETWWGGDKLRFQALLPPGALQDGRNTIKLFLVEDALDGSVQPLPVSY